MGKISVLDPKRQDAIERSWKEWGCTCKTLEEHVEHFDHLERLSRERAERWAKEIADFKDSALPTKPKLRLIK